MPRFDFASDNVSGAVPEVLEAIMEANAGNEPPYGGDHYSHMASDHIRALLDVDAEVRFLASGTAANSVALACLVSGHMAVAAHAHAHIITDEAGAPGFFGNGLGLVGLAGQSGRIDVEALRAALDAPRVSRRQSIGALSITIPTEYGALYPIDHLDALVALAKAHGLRVHVDGARLANAAAAGFDVKRLGAIGVDTLVVGGSKVGGTSTEALVFLNRSITSDLDARLKHMGQLVSKGRFFSAPWVGLLRGEDPAWIRHARHANAMAQQLADAMPFVQAHKPETNAVFVEMDAHSQENLIAQDWLVHRAFDGSVRFMCGWNTDPAAIDAIAAALRIARTP